MRKALIIIKVIIICNLFAYNAAAQGKRPKIGITLSGGGAKGIAHIGLLKAIDSVGLKVDYVTGTSMGSVVGGLYAAGYSGNDLYAIAKTLDWSVLLSNDPPLNTFNLKEKEDLNHYIELPLAKGKISLKRGFIESNELWLALAELFYPYYEITDFSNFDKGFQCIATDVGTGKMVVLTKGNIVKAIRASMAIPSVFTPMEIDGKVLVDGGIVRNFPVSNVREMGADIVIGSDVSGSLNPIEHVKSPLDIISRLPFFNAVSDLEEQKKLVDVYVDYPLDNYGSASFASAEQIMQVGLERGKLLYPTLKRLKDSLDNIYGEEKTERTLKKRDNVYISEYQVNGVPKDEIPFFLDLVKFSPNADYTAKDLSASVRKAFATRVYSKINYSLVPDKQGNAKIIFDVEKPPSTVLQIGFHYNTTTGIALKTGLLMRGFLNPFSAASVMLSLGENPRGKGTIMYYFTKDRKLILQAETSFETVDITTYDQDFLESGLYNQASQNCDLQLLWQPKNNWTLGIGTTLSNVAYDPKITSNLQVEGNVAYVNSFLLLQHNTLNTPLYPNRGRFIYLKGGMIHSQITDFKIYQDEDIIATEDSPFFNSRAYTQIKVALEQYIPQRSNAIFFKVQSGLNFNYKQALVNDFVVGGLNNVIRNQVTFAGLPEASIFTASVITAEVGYQYSLTNNLFLTTKINGLWYDFIKSNFRFSADSRGLGCAFSAGYKTFLGPIEASLMYSDLNKKILPYFNIGYILNI